MQIFQQVVWLSLSLQNKYSLFLTIFRADGIDISLFLRIGCFEPFCTLERLRFYIELTPCRRYKLDRNFCIFSLEKLKMWTIRICLVFLMLQQISTLTLSREKKWSYSFKVIPLSLFIKIRRKEAFTRPQYCSYVSSALRSMSKSSFAIAY